MIAKTRRARSHSPGTRILHASADRGQPPAWSEGLRSSAVRSQSPGKKALRSSNGLRSSSNDSAGLQPSAVRSQSPGKKALRSSSNGSTGLRSSAVRSQSPGKKALRSSTGSGRVSPSPSFGPTSKILNSVTQSLLGSAHYDNEKFETAIKRCIPSEFVLIASQDDHTQAQEDYFAMDNFGLGPHVPKYVRKANAGSVATSALLQLMYEDPKRMVYNSRGNANGSPIDVFTLSRELKKRIKDCTKLVAHPTISSSRPLGPPRLEKGEFAPFYVVPKGKDGVRRALLIGVVSGETADLKGPPNDISNIASFLEKHCGFKKQDITILQDYWGDNAATQPTKRNIIQNFQKLVRQSRAGDVNFIQFSGHG